MVFPPNLGLQRSHTNPREKSESNYGKRQLQSSSLRE